MDRSKRQIDSLIAGCRNNNRASQKELYKLFYSYGMSICMRYSENREDAVEILNDGFMRVFRYIQKFNSDKPFLPWFRKIMVNCAIDHVRKQARKQEKQLEGYDPAVSENNFIEGRIAYNEMLEMIRKLPAAYRTVFNLIAIEGYKHEEVAAILRISVGTSKSNYFRARQKLQQLLKEHFITQ